MATYTIVLGTTAGDYTFTYTPALVINYEYQYNKSAEPPTLAAVEEVWEISDAVLIAASEADLLTAFSTLKTKLESRSQQITGVYFKKDGSTAHSMTTSTHNKFMIENLRMEDTPGHWTNHLKFSMKVSALKGVVYPNGTGTDYENVTQLEMRLSFNYSREGFLTKRLEGKVRTTGATATARARSIGALSLPSAYYQYTTNGPEGVNVTTDVYPADTQASFVCEMQEQALEFPTSVNTIQVSRRIQETKYATLETVTVTVNADSAARALSVARDWKPDGLIEQDEETQIDSRTVRATYTGRVSRSANGIISLDANVSVSGGSEPIEAILVAGRIPILLKTSVEPFKVVEEFRVSSVENIPPIPPPDTSLGTLDKPRVQDSVRALESKTDTGKTQYERTVSRTYYKVTKPPVNNLWRRLQLVGSEATQITPDAMS